MGCGTRPLHLLQPTCNLIDFFLPPRPQHTMDDFQHRILTQQQLARRVDMHNNPGTQHKRRSGAEVQRATKSIPTGLPQNVQLPWSPWFRPF